MSVVSVNRHHIQQPRIQPLRIESIVWDQACPYLPAAVSTYSVTNRPTAGEGDCGPRCGVYWRTSRTGINRIYK